MIPQTIVEQIKAGRKYMAIHDKQSSVYTVEKTIDCFGETIYHVKREIISNDNPQPRYFVLAIENGKVMFNGTRKQYLEG